MTGTPSFQRELSGVAVQLHLTSIVEIKNISTTHTNNEVYEVTTAAGEHYIAKIYKTRAVASLEQDNRFIKQWGSFAKSSNGRNILSQPIFSQESVSVFALDEVRNVIFYEKLSHGHLLGILQTEEQIRYFAKAVALFHRQGLTHTKEISILPSSGYLSSRIKILENALRNVDTLNITGFSPQDVSFLQIQLELLSVSADKLNYKHFPMVPIAVDFNPGNFLIDTHDGGWEVSSRWDYDIVKYASVVFDFYTLSRVVTKTCLEITKDFSPQSLIHNNFKIFLGEYVKYYPLTREELLFIFEAYRYFLLEYVVIFGYNNIDPWRSRRNTILAFSTFFQSLGNLNPEIEFAHILQGLNSIQNISENSHASRLQNKGFQKIKAFSKSKNNDIFSKLQMRQESNPNTLDYSTTKTSSVFYGSNNFFLKVAKRGEGPLYAFPATVDQINRYINQLSRLPKEVQSLFVPIVAYDIDYTGGVAKYLSVLFKDGSISDQIFKYGLKNDILEIFANIFNKCLIMAKYERIKTPQDYFVDTQVRRVLNRLNNGRLNNKKLDELMRLNELTVNGRSLLNIVPLINWVYNNPALISLLTPPRLSVYSGDAHFGNILVNLDQNLIQFADWKGNDYVGDTAYDIGKLFFSFHGNWHAASHNLFTIGFEGDLINYTIFENYKGAESIKMLENHCSAVLLKAFAESDLGKEDPFLLLRSLFIESTHFLAAVNHIIQFEDESKALFAYIRGLELFNQFYDLLVGKRDNILGFNKQDLGIMGGTIICNNISYGHNH